MSESFEGHIGRTYDDSTPWWPPLPRAPEGAPNIVVVLLDDVGYAQLGCYGSDIATPTFDGLAANGRRFSNFHTTALCSPTRACLLTGRNHHSNGMARIAELSAGFPGYNASMPKENGFLSEILVRNGYATYAVGKWHLTPATEMAMGSPRDKWPLARGFERYYGFMAGETDQFHPDLVYDNHAVDPPRTPEEGYHLTEDLADKAIEFVKDLRNVAPDKPFFLWFTPGACHAPHQVPRSYVERYRGHFDDGWDRWRDEVYERQLASGLLPPGTDLSERPHWVPAWDSLSADEQRLYARMMEVYAGFLTHTDEQVGRVLDFLDRLGELDNTIVLVMSDNGASAEGGTRGSFNEQYFFNAEPESLEENLRRIDDLGTPRANNHYPWGWAWAGNTPLKRFKRDTHEGGVADPLVVHWPAGLSANHATQHHYVHAIDVMPTLLELVGIAPPSEIAGIPQSAIEGVSFAPSLRDPDVASAHTTQYYEMFGSRALYHDGWKAVVFHTAPFIAYDGSDCTRPFDADEWELYHVTEDFSEVHDLAPVEPEKLAEMVELWWEEAEKFQVLPLNNEPGRFADTRYRRARYKLWGGTSVLPDRLAPNLRNRSWRISAELQVPAGGAPDGVIVAQGDHSGGYALHIQDGKVRYTNNFLGTQITTVVADATLPVGPVVLRADFKSNGGFGAGGEVTLSYGELEVGRGTIPRTTPITYMAGFAVGSLPATPIEPSIEARGVLPSSVLGRVVVEVERTRPVPSQDEANADLATQ